jgi:Phosphotransferase enzyme family
MISLFLNGGIREHRFHPDLAGLAAQALDLVPHPVPALPGSEFVHGNFTTWNVLASRAGLSAVIGFEGFGRGTRTIDLVALLSSMTGHASAAAVTAVKDRALATSDPLIFRACLAHRVLARLSSATRQNAHTAPVAQHVRALLSLAH